MPPSSDKVETTVTATIRQARQSDQGPLHELITTAGVFSAEEVTVARELIDAGLTALSRGRTASDYHLLVAESPEDGELLGYVCYGRVPFTRSAWDLYWLATHPNHRRRGAARFLCAVMEDDIRSCGGTHVRVETSGTEGYGAARAFYERSGYPLMARIPDFYKPGDDLFSFCKRL